MIPPNEKTRKVGGYGKLAMNWRTVWRTTLPNSGSDTRKRVSQPKVLIPFNRT